MLAMGTLCTHLLEAGRVGASEYRGKNTMMANVLSWAGNVLQRTAGGSDDSMAIWLVLLHHMSVYHGDKLGRHQMRAGQFASILKAVLDLELSSTARVGLDSIMADRLSLLSYQPLVLAPALRCILHHLHNKRRSFVLAKLYEVMVQGGKMARHEVTEAILARHESYFFPKGRETQMSLYIDLRLKSRQPVKWSADNFDVGLYQLMHKHHVDAHHLLTPIQNSGIYPSAASVEALLPTTARIVSFKLYFV